LPPIECESLHIQAPEEAECLIRTDGADPEQAGVSSENKAFHSQQAAAGSYCFDGIPPEKFPARRRFSLEGGERLSHAGLRRHPRSEPRG